MPSSPEIRGGRTAQVARDAAGRWSRLPIFWQLFLPNAAVLIAATAALIFLPITVSEPISADEALIILMGMVAMVTINLLLIRRSMVPLQRLSEAMADVDPLQPEGPGGAIDGSVEVKRLAAAFDAMTRRLALERRTSARLMLDAQEDERLRLGRELHDELGQSLTGIMLALDHAAAQASGPLQGSLGELREEVRGLQVDVGRIVKRLRPDALDELGLRSGLLALADRFSEQTGIAVTHRLPPELPPLRPEAELVIYRVAQEALNNVARHAKASRTSVVLEAGDPVLTMRVTDNGRGIGPVVARSGIQGMRERALLIGADLRIGDLPNGGTEILLRVPWVEPS